MVSGETNIICDWCTESGTTLQEVPRLALYLTLFCGLFLFCVFNILGFSFFSHLVFMGSILLFSFSSCLPGRVHRRSPNSISPRFGH